MSDLFSMTVENLVDGPDCPQAEVVDICSRMIQIDSQNFGPQDARGEVEMCHYVTGLLDEIGVGVTLHESEPGRVTLVAEWAPEGTDTSRPALLLHGHSDTVPFEAADWTHHPLSGEIHDNCVWGRGAIDMKGFLAMVLSAIRARQRRGEVPSRPIRFIMFADE